jgi:anti-sigma-K factor RskA
MTHDDIQAELAAFALGALDPLEREEIAAHLASGCAACARELAEWREVVGSIALAGSDADAPNLKAALWRRMQREGRRPRVVPKSRWRPSTMAATAMTAIAATVLLVLGVVRDAGLRREIEQLRRDTSRARTDLAVTHDRLRALSDQLAAKEHDVAALRAALAAAEESLKVLRAPDLQLVRLTQPPQAPPAVAHALINADTGRALFYAFDLPPVPADKAYELWWITERQGPVRAGVFVPDATGLGRVDASIPTDAGPIQAAAVTIEPAGGVAKPTGPMVLLGKLAAPS